MVDSTSMKHSISSLKKKQWGHFGRCYLRTPACWIWWSHHELRAVLMGRQSNYPPNATVLQFPVAYRGFLAPGQEVKLAPLFLIFANFISKFRSFSQVKRRRRRNKKTFIFPIVFNFGFLRNVAFLFVIARVNGSENTNTLFFGQCSSSISALYNFPSHKKF